MPARRRFHPVPLLAGVLVAALTFQLGNWQVRRAGEKEALQARIERLSHEAPTPYAGATVPEEWQRLAVRGRWLAERALFIDNRVHAGRAGYHLVMPLAVSGSDQVLLVNRGWVPVGADRTRLPVVVSAKGEVELAGAVRMPEDEPFSLSAKQVEGAVWQNIDLPAIAGRTGLKLAPFVLQQTSTAEDGLLRDWPRPDAGIDRHKGYALQWYGLSALAVVLMAIHIFRRWRRDDDAQG